MGAINRFPAGGGSKINGIIEEYKVAAGENVSAGDFVSFIQKLKTERELSAGIMLERTYSYEMGTFSAAFEFEENKVIFAYERENPENDHKLIAAVVTIDGASFTAQEYDLGATEMYTWAFANNSVELAHMKDNEFIMFHYHRFHNNSGANMTYRVYRLTLNDGVPSITTLTFYNSDGSTLNFSTQLDNFCPIFVAPDHLYFIRGLITSGSGTTLYSAQIVGDNINVKSTLSLTNSSTGNVFGYSPKIVLLDNKRIAYSSGGYNSQVKTMHGIATLSDDGYYALSCTKIEETTRYQARHLFVADNDRLVVIYQNYSDSTYSFYAKCLYINADNTVTNSNGTLLGSSRGLNVIQLDYNKFLAVGNKYNDATKVEFWLITLTADGEFNLEAWQPLIGASQYSGHGNFPLCAYNGEKIFVAGCGLGTSAFNYGIWGGLTNTIIEPTVATYDTSREICGVAKGSGAAGEVIEVTVPEVMA